MNIFLDKVLIIGNSPESNITKENREYFTVALGEGYYHLPPEKIQAWFVREPAFLKRPYDCRETIIVTDLQLSLGMYAINYFLRLPNKKVHITGITLDLSSPYIQCGAFWQKNLKRDNYNHNLVKETLTIKKLLYDKRIFQF